MTGSISAMPSPLKRVWKSASLSGQASGASPISAAMRSTRPANGSSSARATAAVTRLKITWAPARRRPAVLAPKAPITAVTVVPMLAPMAMASAGR